MTSRCYGNPAQYERNRRFRHLVHVLANGASLPSAGLWLNASKSESRPDMRRYLSHHCVGRQRYELRARVEPQQKVFADPPISAGGDLDDIHPMRRGGVKSFVDDLVLGRGVVISRAATSLRSVETQPLTRRFVRNQTNDISVPSLSRVGGLSLCLAAGARSPPTVGLGQLGGERAHHGSLDCGSRLAASAGVAPRSLGPFSQVRARDTHGGVSVLGLSLFLVRPLGSEARRFDSCRGHSFSMCASPRSHAVSFRKSWVLWPVTHADDPSRRLPFNTRTSKSCRVTLVSVSGLPAV